MIWVGISFLSFFPAYYTKDKGAAVILLRRNPKEYVIEIALSLPIAFVYELMIPHWE